MLNQFSRSELLLGKEAMEKLAGAKVAVFGIGGVGGYVCEALARTGIGSFDLIDDDKVCLTNINRQIIATRKTIGKYKAEVMRDRILEINPNAQVEIHKCFFLPEFLCIGQIFQGIIHTPILVVGIRICKFSPHSIDSDRIYIGTGSGTIRKEHAKGAS